MAAQQGEADSRYSQCQGMNLARDPSCMSSLALSLSLICHSSLHDDAINLNQHEKRETLRNLFSLTHEEA